MTDYGNGIPGDTRPVRRRRSVAWIYYAIIAVLALFAVPATNGGALLISLLAGAYSTYLYRGGRLVIWIW